MTDMLYVAVGGDSPCLARYVLDQNGPASAPRRTPLPGAPADLAIAPDGRFLYADVSVERVHQAHSFRIQPSDGELEPIGTPTHVGPYPCYIRVDGTGRFLLAAYYSDGMVTVHAIGVDGVVGARVQKVKTAPCCHFIQTDAANRFAFAPHVCDENAIWQFRFDARTGRLSPNDPPKASPGPGHGPRHMYFHPNGRFAFSNGEQGSSVTAWSYDAGAGALTPLGSLSTLPQGWAGDNTCSQLHLTPDGRFLYSCNRGHDSLAGFAVDGATGSLRSLGPFAAEATPRPTAVSPDGRWLFSAGRPPFVVAYRIDAQTGALVRSAQLDTGPVSWLLTARLP